MNCFDRYPVLKINSVPLDLDHLLKNKSILQHSPGQEASTKVTHNISSRLCHSISVVLHIDIAKEVKVTKPSVWTRLCAARINSRSATDSARPIRYLSTVPDPSPFEPLHTAL